MKTQNIHPSWSDILENEFSQEYYQNIKKTIVNDINL
jgi:uracil DNA glycosylase